MIETLLVLIFRWTSEGSRLVHRCYQAESLFGRLVRQEGKVSHYKLLIHVSACAVVFLKEPTHNSSLRICVNVNHVREWQKYTSCNFSYLWLTRFA